MVSQPPTTSAVPPQPSQPVPAEDEDGLFGGRLQPTPEDDDDLFGDRLQPAAEDEDDLFGDRYQPPAELQQPAATPPVLSLPSTTSTVPPQPSQPVPAEGDMFGDLLGHYMQDPSTDPVVKGPP